LKTHVQNLEYPLSLEPFIFDVVGRLGNLTPNTFGRKHDTDNRRVLETTRGPLHPSKISCPQTP